MKNIKFVTQDAKHTIEFGHSLSRFLKRKDIVCLYGDLGTGKTTLVKGIARGFGIPLSKVHSPTFVLMNIYEGRLPIYHFDMYRIDGNDGMATVGYDEFFYGDGIAVVEWPERLGVFLPDDFLKIEIEHAGDDKRSFCISSLSGKYEELITGFKKIIK